MGDVNGTAEGLFSSLAAIVLLFTAMGDPALSLGATVVVLAGLIVFRLRNQGRL
jgi:hypothetical protein